MTTEEMQEIISRVLSQTEEWKRQASAELPLEFPIETSARHVHLTEEAIARLFGEGARLTPKRSLSQPGQFLSEERVALVTPKGRIDRVAVLGPARAAIQTELSAGDCVQLGIQAPVRLSGDLTGAGDVYIVGPRGMIDARGSVIIAKAHLHITPDEAKSVGIRNGQRVSVRIPGRRQVTIGDVICRVSASAKLAMHIDLDEANACMVDKGARGRMRLEMGGDCRAVEEPAAGVSGQAAVRPSGWRAEQPGVALKGGRRLVTEEEALRLAAAGHKRVMLAAGTLVTPAARDAFGGASVEIEWLAGGV